MATATNPFNRGTYNPVTKVYTNPKGESFSYATAPKGATIVFGGGGGSGGNGRSSGGTGINPAIPTSTGGSYDNSAALAAQAAADAATANAAKQNLINQQIAADRQAAISSGQQFYPVYNRNAQGEPLSIAYYKSVTGKNTPERDIINFRNAVRAGTENLPTGEGTSLGVGTVQQVTSKPTYTLPANILTATGSPITKSTIQGMQSASTDYTTSRLLEPIPKYTAGIATNETYIKPTFKYGNFEIANEQILGARGQQLIQSNKPLNILEGQALGLAAFGIAGTKAFVNTINPVNILSMPEFIFSGNVIDKLSSQIEDVATGLRQTPATTSGSIAGTATGMYVFGKAAEVVKGAARRESIGEPKSLFEGLKEPFVNPEIKTPIKNDNAIIKFGEDPRLRTIRENLKGNIDYTNRIIQNKIDIVKEPVVANIKEAGIKTADIINQKLLGGKEIQVSQESLFKRAEIGRRINELNQEADIQSIINKANKKYVNDFFSTRAEDTRLSMKGQRETIGKSLRELGIQQDKALLNPFREIKSKANQLKFNAAEDIKDSLDVVNTKARSIINNSELYNRYKRYSARRGSVEWEISKNIVDLNKEAKLQSSINKMNKDYVNRFFSDRADEILSSDLKSMQNARQYLKNKYTGVKLQSEILKYNIGDIIGEKIINTKKIINKRAARSGTFLNENLFQGKDVRKIIENSEVYARLQKYSARKGSQEYAIAEKIYNLNKQAETEITYRKIMRKGVNDFFYEKGKAVYGIKPALETRKTNIGELARKQFEGADLGVENSETLKSLNKFDKDYADSTKTLIYELNPQEIAQMRKLARTKARGVIDFGSYEPTAETMKSNLPADLGEKSSLPKTLRSKSNFPKELGKKTSLPTDLNEKSIFNNMNKEAKENPVKIYKRFTPKEPEIKDVFIDGNTQQLLLKRPRIIPSLIEEAKESARIIREEKLIKLKPARRIRTSFEELEETTEPKLKYNSKQYLVEPTQKNRIYPVYKQREAFAGVQSDYAQVMKRPITKQVYPQIQIFNQPQVTAFTNAQAQSSAQAFAEPQLFAQPIAFAQPQGSAQAQRFNQSDKQLLKQEYKFDENNFMGLIGKEKKRRQTLKRIALYNVLARKGKKYIPIGSNISRNEAISIGSNFALNNITRTFKIVKSGKTKEVFDIKKEMFAQPDLRVFRNYQIRNKRQIPLQNTFIQRSRYNLQSSGEKFQIQEARRMKKLMRGLY